MSPDDDNTIDDLLSLDEAGLLHPIAFPGAVLRGWATTGIGCGMPGERCYLRVINHRGQLKTTRRWIAAFDREIAEANRQTLSCT